MQSGSEWERKEKKRLLLAGHFLGHRLPARPSNLGMRASKVSTDCGFQGLKARDSGQEPWQQGQLL